jgi:hypothetical protein
VIAKQPLKPQMVAQYRNGSTPQGWCKVTFYYPQGAPSNAQPERITGIFASIEEEGQFEILREGDCYRDVMSGRTHSDPAELYPEALDEAQYGNEYKNLLDVGVEAWNRWVNGLAAGRLLFLGRLMLFVSCTGIVLGLIYGLRGGFTIYPPLAALIPQSGAGVMVAVVVAGAGYGLMLLGKQNARRHEGRAPR